MSKETAEEAIDSTAEELPPEPVDEQQPPPAATELVPTAGAGAIIRADEPSEIIEKATRIANALKDLIDRQDLAKNLGGSRKHVEVGGWQALGTMLGALGGEPLHAETVWTRLVVDAAGAPIRTPFTVRFKRKKWGKVDGKRAVVEETEGEFDVEGLDWEARVEIKTAAGAVVGSADAMCSRTEDTWHDRAEYAVRSMAETRAESRAYRRAVGWIVSIAGYNPTPAEEMGGGQAVPDAPAGPPFGPPASAKLKTAANNAMKYLLENGAAASAWQAIMADLKESGDVYLPAIVARSLVHCASAKHNQAEPADDGEKGGDAADDDRSDEDRKADDQIEF